MSQVSQLLRAIRSGFLVAGLLTCGCSSRSLFPDAGSPGDTRPADRGAVHDAGSDSPDTGETPDTGAPADADADAAGDSGAPADAGADAGVTPPTLPADRTLTCPGPHYPTDGGFGFRGSCCEHVVCRQPVAGLCPTGNDGRSYGSGTCLCGAATQAEAIKGPYTIAEDDPRFAVERQAGPCCYITTSVGCDGRPLHIAEAVRVAPVVVRGDWC